MMEVSEDVVYRLRGRLIRKRKCVDSSDHNISGGDMSLGLLDLPELTLEKIFSFLPARDLKKFRLASTRSSEEVLILDRRFKTWTIDISKGVPQETEKVFQYNLKLQVDISKLEEVSAEVVSWLIKHSSCITGLLYHNVSYEFKILKVLKSLPELKQVRKLDLTDITGEAFRTLLSSFGPELESVNVTNGIGELKDTFLSLLNQPRLKHLELKSRYNVNVPEMVPTTIESLTLDVYGIKFPFELNQLNHLKILDICLHDKHRFNLTKLLSKSLTGLWLQNVNLKYLESVDIDLPSLKVLVLCRCDIKMGFLKNLLMKSAQSLRDLTLYLPGMIEQEDIDFTLLALTHIHSINVENSTWLQQLINASARTLTTLIITRESPDCFDEFTCHLPLLTGLDLEAKKYIVSSSDLTVKKSIDWSQQLLSACANSLTFLRLYGAQSSCLNKLVNDLPVLTTLKLEYLRNINWLPQLISACSSTLTDLILNAISSCGLDQLDCDLPVLKKLHISNMGNFNWLPQLLSACSSTLTNLKLRDLHSFSLDELACDLPALKVLNVSKIDLDINHLLRKCSSSLQILKLFGVKIKFEVNIPNLKELYPLKTEVDGFTNLVWPQDSSIEIIGLRCDVTGSIWEDIVRCRFPNLKVVHMIELDDDKCDTLKKIIIKPHVLVLTDEKKLLDYLQYL